MANFSRAKKLGKRIKEMPKKKKIIFGVIIVIVLAIIGSCSGKKGKKGAFENGTDIVTRGDVSSTITGSASVEPYERYEIMAKVSGDIVACPYEVGDMVEKDTVLYKFDTSSTDISMEKQRLSVEQSHDSYQNAVKDADKLYITAKADGVISDLGIKVGDDVKTGAKIAQINNTKLLEVTLPFNASQISNIYVGETAYVSSSAHMSNVSGRVVHKDSNATAGSGGSMVYNVKIQFENPGAFYEGLVVGGSVGNEVSVGSGEVKLSDSAQVAAETDGTVTAIYHKNGDYVTRGTNIAHISSDKITDSIKSSSNNYKNAQLSMQDAQDKLDDYTLTSPINGTVITKNSKAGDTIDKTNASQVLMVVADVSKLKFDLEIDELDVRKVTSGQKVEVSCDALPNEEFEGEITNISVEGRSENGVTTYTAEVVINEPGNLRPSMNIDASVVIEQSENTLLLPTEDVKSIGNMHYVFKKSDGTTQEKSDKKGEKSNGDGEKPNMPNGEKSNADGEKPSMPSGDSKKSGNRRMPEAPEGYEFVMVEIGVTGDDYIEILSGLSEGDEVYKQSTAQNNNGSMMAGMMGGGRSGGGMSSGGGHPGGGMGGR